MPTYAHAFGPTPSMCRCAAFNTLQLPAPDQHKFLQPQFTVTISIKQRESCSQCLILHVPCNAYVILCMCLLYYAMSCCCVLLLSILPTVVTDVLHVTKTPIEACRMACSSHLSQVNQKRCNASVSVQLSGFAALRLRPHIH